MSRYLLLALAATALVLPAAANARDELRLRGTVTATSGTAATVTVTSARLVHTLSVPGSLARIRVGQRVELRGTTLRRHGNGSRVLARGVLLVRSELRASPAQPVAPAERAEARGSISSLAPLTVAGVTCAVPAGVSLAGFAVGDLVEMQCVLVGTVLTLRRLESEQADNDEDIDDDEHEDDDHGNRGHGGGGGDGGHGHG